MSRPYGDVWDAAGSVGLRQTDGGGRTIAPFLDARTAGRSGHTITRPHLPAA